MTTQARLRNQYARETVGTASPAKLVTMLYDRLLKDLSDATAALAAGNVQTRHNALTHAQEILREFHATLDTSVWKEGENLKRLYEWAIDELVTANVEMDAQRIEDVKSVIAPLADAWHQAARISAE